MPIDRPIPTAYRGVKGLSLEAARVLGQRCNAMIGSINPDGTVHMAPVWFLHEPPGAIYFESNSATRKARNIATRSKASVLVKGHEEDGSGFMVLGQGEGRLVVGDPARELSLKIRKKYLTASGLGPVSQYLDAIDDSVVEIVPSHWVSWSASNMNDAIRALPEFEGDCWDSWFIKDSA